MDFRGFARPKLRSIAGARSLLDSGLTPRLRRFCLAAFVTSGDLPLIQSALGCGSKSLNQQLSMLRSTGAARTVCLFDPARCGRPLESSVLVQLQHGDGARICVFERWCQEEEAITGAAKVCGRFDYRLTTFHRDERDANDWRRQLEARPETRSVEMRPVRTIKGSGLAGIPLRP